MRPRASPPSDLVEESAYPPPLGLPGEDWVSAVSAETSVPAAVRLELPRPLRMPVFGPSLETPWGPWDLFMEFCHETPRVSAAYPEVAEALSLALRWIEALLPVPYERGPALGSVEPQPSGPPRVPSAESFRFYLSLGILQNACRTILETEPEDTECRQILARCLEDIRTAAYIDLGRGIPARDAEAALSVRGRWTPREKPIDLDVRLRQTLEEATSSAFVESEILPRLGRGHRADPAVPCEAAVVRDIGTGRATVAYLARGGPVAFGKIYSDAAQAEHSFRVQEELWTQGLSAPCANRVPEPVAYLRERGLVLLRAARGLPLSTLFEEGHLNLGPSCRRAARWLVDLHRSPVRVGEREAVWRSMWLLRILRRLSKAAASAPAYRRDLVGMVDTLHDLGRRGLWDVPVVQAHGTFHFEHVLIDRRTTTVIDFDRSFPSDPAKDLAEFLRFMRWKTVERTGSVRQAEGPTRAFLKEYTDALPEHAANLRVYWAAFVLINLFRRVAKHHEDASFDRELAFFMNDFDSIVSGEMLP